MYIDARKPLYASDPAAAAQVARDRAYAEQSYRAWMESEAADAVGRLWEIVDIGLVERTGAFIRLLKEAEFTFSLKAYTSAIALTGVCAEDLSRFLGDLAGQNTDSLSQYDRIGSLAQSGIISAAQALLLHDIRRVRNDCLHYNQGFKAKDDAALKADALMALNALKQVYAELVGATAYDQFDPQKLLDVVEAISHEASNGEGPGVRSLEDSVMRTRNVLAQVTGVDLSLDLGGKPHLHKGTFVVLELDVEGLEVTLQDTQTGFPIIIDLEPDRAAQIARLGIEVGDEVYAAILSITQGLGMTAEWRFVAGPAKA